MVLSSYILTTAALLAWASSAFATTRKYTFNVADYTAAPDGYTTSVRGVNNQWGVPMTANVGDTLSVTVNNNLNVSTAIHFHGILQNGTNWYDGAAGVTQCPIASGDSLTYQFKLKQHGTYWWHSHYKSQYIAGLKGPLIIQDPTNEPYTADYDSEIIVQLTDWYHTSVDTLLAQFMAPNGNGIEPLPDSGLINGKGRYNCAYAQNVRAPYRMHHGRSLKASSCTANSSLTVFNVTPGKRYRFRIINMSAMASFNFSIDGHKMDIIEMDGTDTVKTTVDVFRISPAQRYSAIVTMNATASSYWVRALIDESQWTGANFTGILDPEVHAILQYGTGTPKGDPTSTPNPNPTLLNSYSLGAYTGSPPANADINFGFRFDIIPDSNNATVAVVTVDDQFSNSQYMMPDTPTLFDVQQGNALPNSSNAVNITGGNVVDITVWNDDPTEHVFHLHGYKFWVISYGQALNNAIHPSNTTSVTPYRDTVAVPGCRPRTRPGGEGICGGGLGYLKIRFIADNPGVWLFHCHMEWHMAAGLAWTLVIDTPTIQDQGNNMPYSVSDTCYSSGFRRRV